MRQVDLFALGNFRRAFGVTVSEKEPRAMLLKTVNSYLVVIVCWPAFAQNAAQPQANRPAFEVASVKPYDSKAGQTPREFGCSPAGRFTALRNSVLTSIRWAYGVNPYELVGKPAWSNGVEGIYDIEARATGAVTEDQCRLMVQTLLADRFKMAAHRETRSLPVGALVVGKGGPKMTKALDSDTGAGVFVNKVPAAGSTKGWSMAQFAIPRALFPRPLNRR